MTSGLQDILRRRTRVSDRGQSEFHIGEADTPWVPLVKGVAWIKHLSFDTRNGSAVHVLKVDAGGILERHRHRGPVVGYTLRGSWHYLEYEWVAQAGSWVHEFPGAIHTLASEAGMETLFWLTGPIELLDEHDDVVDLFDVFWYVNNYLSHCERTGLEVNEQLFV